MTMTLSGPGHAAAAGRTGPTAVRTCGGATLLEVLAAIFVMGVGMLALLTLLPLGALTMRKAVNEDRAAADALTISSAIADFQTYELRLPVSISELTPYLNGDHRFEDGEEDGFGFSLDTDGAVTAEPVAPGKTGVRCFLKRLGQPLVDCTTPAAIERARQAERIMLDSVRALTAEASADVLRLDPSGQAPALARSFCKAQTLISAFATMDADHNGLIGWRELLGPDTAIPRVSAFRSRVAFELELGVGDENLDAFPGLTSSAFEGDPCFVYTFDTLRFLVARYTAAGGLQASLTAKLDAAEEASAMGHVSAKSALLRAFANQVRAQQGKALTARDAGVLITLAGTV